MQDDDAVREAADHVHLVLDQQDRPGAVGPDGVDQVEDDGRLIDAHARGRLVEHENLRFHRQHDRDLQLALVAVRQGRRAGIGAVRQGAAREISARPLEDVAMRARHAEEVDAQAGARRDG